MNYILGSNVHYLFFSASSAPFIVTFNSDSWESVEDDTEFKIATAHDKGFKINYEQS